MFMSLKVMNDRMDEIARAIDEERFAYAGVLIRDMQFDIRELNNQLESQDVEL